MGRPVSVGRCKVEPGNDLFATGEALFPCKDCGERKPPDQFYRTTRPAGFGVFSALDATSVSVSLRAQKGSTKRPLHTSSVSRIDRNQFW